MPDGGFEALAAQALDEITDMVVIFDSAFQIMYANPFACDLIGAPREAVIGTAIADYVHPDDLERAITVLARLQEDEAPLPVTPAFYRLRGQRGPWLRVELNGTLMNTPEGVLTIVFGRYSGDHDLQDRVMDLLMNEAPHEEAIALVPEFGYWRHSNIDYAVFFYDDDGKPQSSGSDRLTCLGGLDDPGTPWAEIARTGHDKLTAIEALARPYRERAALANFTHVWGIAVEDPLHESHAVVAFARRDGEASAEMHGYALDVMCKALRLILQWRHQVQGLRQAARRDPLTGLANRTGFWSILGALEITSQQELIGLLYVDLDGFKEVNDHHGHAVGDLVLAEAAHRLDSAVRPGDLVARLGGDEFAIVARDVHKPEDAMAIAERVVTGLGEAYSIGERSFQIGASVGVAVADAGNFDADDLLERADAALYRAKASGRGRWMLAEPAS